MKNLLIFVAAFAFGADWTAPVEVRHDETLCLTYSAKVDGPYLLVKAKIEPGWHTFTMDNKQRAEVALGGKKALGLDQPTRIVLTGGLASDGKWLQSNPKDFSKPEMRWYSWGYEGEAVFATKVTQTAAAETTVRVRGQACSDTTCKNIDVSIVVPKVAPGGSSSSTVNLIPVQ